MKRSSVLLKKSFSIIELMTVILVVLLLISLLIPLFSDLKMNARSALCKNNLRQIGVLNISYATDFGGYLPNNNLSDLGGGVLASNEDQVMKSSANNLLYEGWNGHLLPYLQSSGKNYDKRARLGIVKNSSGITEAVVRTCLAGVGWSDTDLAKSDPSWNIINNTIAKGGSDELKIFICPEIHANTYDISFSNTYNGIQIPRISQIGNGTFQWNTYVPSGVPSTYLANPGVFGWDYIGGSNDSPVSRIYNSKRLDQMSNISKKIFLVEGGSFTSQSKFNANYYAGGLYFEPSDFMNFGYDNQRLSFVHDNLGEYWQVSVKKIWFGDLNIVSKIQQDFSLKFKGKAELMVKYDWPWGYTIISYLNPADRPFDAFFAANVPKAWGWDPVANISAVGVVIDFPELHFKVGKMNVLFGDGAVSNKDLGWLTPNITRIFSEETE